MYQDFYQLERAPFNTTPDPAFFYASPVHQEALAAIAYGVENRKGFISLIGEVGTGKTTVLRTYIGSSELENTRIIYLFNPNVTFDDLLVMVLRELEIEHEIPRDQTRRIDLLHRVLVREYKRGNNVVLIIDEAQNVPPETLESIRLLTNIETDSEKLIQIILCGQPELKRLLAMQSLRQLRERIAVKTELRPLTKSEAIEYIHHRLKRARQPQDGAGGVGRVNRGSNSGGGGDSVFTDDAINEVIRRTGGNPRAINILCDNALITGYGYQKYPIASPIIREIAKELDDGLPPKSGFASDGERSGWARVAGYGLATAALLAVLAIGGLMLFRALFDRVDDPAAVAQTQTGESQQDQSQQNQSQLNADNQNTANVGENSTQVQPVASTTNPVAPVAKDIAVEASTTSTNSDGTGLNNNADANEKQSVSSGVVTLDSNSGSTTSGVVTVANDGKNKAESAPQPAANIEENQPISLQQKPGNTGSDVTAQIMPAATDNNLKSQVVRAAPQTVTDAKSPQKPVKVVSTDGASGSSGASSTPQSQSASAASNSKTQDKQQDKQNGQQSGQDGELKVADSSATNLSDDAYFAVRTVNAGDVLWNMVLDVYGVASPQIMEWLLDQNPQIANRDVINVGESVNFPNLPERFLQ